MIPSGRRDKRVQLDKPGPSVPDGEGGYTEAPVPLDPAEAFVSIAPSSAADLERAAVGVTVAQATHVITMRYHPGVDIYTRITYGARVFQVTSVRNPDEANRELVIVAQELLP
jgi:SPP1 family predicted phage head-tail adaptor